MPANAATAASEISIVVGNIVVNSSLVGVAVFFCKKWFDAHTGRIDELKESVDKLSDHVATANGRTAKNEKAIAIHAAVCPVMQRRKTAGCDNVGDVL